MKNRKDSLEGILSNLYNLADAFHLDVNIRSLITFLELAKKDIEGEPTNSQALREIMKMTPNQKSTLSRSVALLTGKTRNTTLKFDYVLMVENPTDYRVKDLILSPSGKRVVTNLLKES